MKSFKREFSLEERKTQTQQAKEKYPDRIPVYVHKRDNSRCNDLAKHKYLVPNDITIGNFIYIIRKNININPDQAIFVFIDNILPPNAELMSTLYNKYCDDDGFLYISYSDENVFG